MTIKLLLIGKTRNATLENLTKTYADRLRHYGKFEFDIIPELKTRKNMSAAVQKTKEGEAILKKISSADEVILLDEKGKERDSVGFANWLQKQMNTGKKQLVFIVGGPFGFSEAVYKRANQKIALSKMTFSHEMIRPIFVEQLYRAHTILRNEPYHHS